VIIIIIHNIQCFSALSRVVKEIVHYNVSWKTNESITKSRKRINMLLMWGGIGWVLHRRRRIRASQTRSVSSQQLRYTPFTRSSKRPANVFKIHVLIAGRLLDRVNGVLVVVDRRWRNVGTRVPKNLIQQQWLLGLICSHPNTHFAWPSVRQSVPWHRILTQNKHAQKKQNQYKRSLYSALNQK